MRVWPAVLCLGCGWLLAQSAAVCPQAQAYRAGSRLVYDLTLDSELSQAGLTDSGRLETTAAIEMAVLGGADEGAADMRFTAFQTTVQAGPAALADLKAAAAQYAGAALAMPAARIRLGRQAVILSRPEGDRYDQGLTLLQDLAYGDALPTTPVQPGATWTVQRAEFVPALHTSLPSTMKVKLVSLDATAATLEVHSEGSVDLPLDQIPGREQALAAGLVPRDTVSFSSDGTERFRLGDGILLGIASHSQNKQHMTFTGARSAPPIDEVVTSTSTIKLASETPAP